MIKRESRIKRAIREFEALQPKSAALSSEILRDWGRDRVLLRQAVWHGSQANPNQRSVSELWWIRWFFPWEIVRLERLEDAVWARDLEHAQSIERELDKTGFVTTTSERIAEWDRNAFPYNYWRTTLAPPDVVANPFTGPEHYVDELAIVRMRLIELALLDFKREHHKLPDSLHELVPAYFAKLPIDPCEGADFLYEPKGISGPLQFKNCRIDFGTPFLASTGALEARFVRRPNGSYEVVSRFPDNRNASGSIWFPGMAIELPGSVRPVLTPKGSARGNAFRVTFELTQQAVAAEQ